MGRNNFYAKNYTDWPPIPNEEYNDPNSMYWETECRKVEHLLLIYGGPDLLTVKQGEVVALPNITWKAAHGVFFAAFNTVKNIGVSK